MKEKESKRYHHILLAAVLLLLFLPILPIQKFAPSLKAYVADKKAPKYDNTSWFNGEYQEKWNEHAKSDLNFKRFFSSLNNDIKYHVFNDFPLTSKTEENYILGKEGSVFMNKHIDATLGFDSVGKTYIHDKIIKLKKVQDTLAKKGVKFLFVFNASRGKTLYDEIPDRFIRRRAKETNQDYFKEYFNDYGINYLDVTEYINHVKDTVSYKLFPKHGLHLTKQAEFIYIDTLIGTCEKMLGHPLPRYKITGFHRMLANNKPYFSNGSECTIPTETEMLRGLHFFWGPKEDELDYPEVEVDTMVSPSSKAYVVSDSFFQTAFHCNILTKVFEDGKFYYYNKQQYHDGVRNLPKQSFERVQKEVESHDIFIIASTESNLSKAGFGIIDQLYFHYFVPKEKHERELKILKQEQCILAVRNWHVSLLKAAKKSNKPFVDVLRSNAVYVLRQGKEIK